jgi:hypothetical protein
MEIGIHIQAVILFSIAASAGMERGHTRIVSDPSTSKKLVKLYS